jgi:hypothetical protein
MTSPLAPADADKLAAFARAARPVTTRATSLVARGGQEGLADRLVEHWRREAVVLTGLTGLGGRLASAAQDAVSTAVQCSLVLCLCEAAGVDDLRERVRVLAAVVLDGALPEQWQPSGDEGEPAAEQDDEGARQRLVALGKQVWSVRRVTRGHREGRLWHRGLAVLPVVGAAGLVLGERHALEEVAARAAAELGPTPRPPR